MSHIRLHTRRDESLSKKGVLERKSLSRHATREIRNLSSCVRRQALAFLNLIMTTLDHIGSAFLRRILRRMRELGVNQSELAKRMKVSKPYITKVLRQDVNFSFRTAAKLAHALEMDFFPELREKV